MYREVSDLSFGSISEDEDPVEASPQSGSVKAYEGTNDSSWKTYTNDLDTDVEVGQLEGDDVLQDSADSAGELSRTRGTLRFNTTFEPSQDEDLQSEQAELPASWAACDMTDLAVVAAHLASAALPPVQQSAHDQYATDALLLQSPLVAEDMLGFGTLDLRSCTLIRRAAAFATTQRLGMHASFSHSVQVLKARIQCILADIIRTADALHCQTDRQSARCAGGRHQCYDGQNIKCFQTWQLCGRAIASAGITHWHVLLWRFEVQAQTSGHQLLRLEETGMAPLLIACNPPAEAVLLTACSTQVLPDGEDFNPETYLTRLHQVRCCSRIFASSPLHLC